MTVSSQAVQDKVSVFNVLVLSTSVSHFPRPSYHAYMYMYAQASSHKHGTSIVTQIPLRICLLLIYVCNILLVSKHFFYKMIRHWRGFFGGCCVSISVYGQSVYEGISLRLTIDLAYLHPIWLVFVQCKFPVMWCSRTCKIIIYI